MVLWGGVSLLGHHVSCDLEGGQEGPQLYFFTGAKKKSVLQLSKFDEQVDPDFLREVDSVHVKVNLSQDVLWNAMTNSIQSFWIF